MTRLKMRQLWTLASVLLLALVASVILPSHAWGSRLQHGGHIGKHQQHRHHHFRPSARTGIRHRHFHHHHHRHFHHRHHRHFHHRHHHGRSGLFLGLGFYGYPYPYYYPYYYESYTPGDHRRFPAFRLPEFFHYPGAIGKGEESIKP